MQTSCCSATSASRASLKSETVVAQQMVGRTREALTDYANALLLQDWHEEQRAARRAGLVLDGEP